MNKDEYEKVFQHINDLAQKNALGKISHETMYDGLKKLLEEVIAAGAAHFVKAERRKAFWRGGLTASAILGALAYLGFILWQKGLLSAWTKGMKF